MLNNFDSSDIHYPYPDPECEDNCGFRSPLIYYASNSNINDIDMCKVVLKHVRPNTILTKWGDETALERATGEIRCYLRNVLKEHNL